MSASLLWLLVPLAPLIGVGLLFVRMRPEASRTGAWCWLLCLPALLLCLFPPEPLTLHAAWPGALLGAEDFMTRVWLAFTALLWSIAAWAADDVLRGDLHRQRFWVFWMLSLSGNLLLIIAQDALSFYVGFSVMSLAAYGLIVHKKGPEARRAGRMYLQLAIVAELMLFTGIILRSHAAGGTTEFAAWGNTSADGLTVILLLTGLGIKAGFWPLHIWLPKAHPVAPAPASAVLSGAMIKAGILGLWRFLPGEPELEQWALPLLLVGMFSALYGVAAGLTRMQAKEVLAYSSVSQMGYMLMIIALYWQTAAEGPVLAILLAMYAMHHAFSKGALFIGAGLTARMPHSDRLFWIVLALPAAALAGLPFSSGAAVKALLKEGFYSAHLTAWILMLQLGALATTLLILRAWILMRSGAGTSSSEQATRGSTWPIAVLGALLVTLPLLWPALRQATIAMFDPLSLLEVVWPVLLGIAAVILALRLGVSVPQRLQRLPDPVLMSLRLRRILLRWKIPDWRIPWNRQRLRQQERRWNRLWQTDTVNRSVWMLILFITAAAAALVLL